MSTQFRGDINNGVVEGAIVINVKPSVGGTTKRTFKGKESDIKAKAIELQNLGYETEITSGKPAWELTASLPWDISQSETEQEPPPVWEIQGHAVEQNILECNDRPLIQGLSTTTKSYIEYALKNPTTDFPLTTSTETAQFDNAWITYVLMRSGVEARQNFTTSVKRTITVSTRYNSTWSLTNVGKVMSKAALVGNYNVPAYIANLLPEGSAAIETETADIYTFRGYLEQHPNYQSVSNGKIQISQEWIFNKWSAGPNGLYEVV